MRNRIFVVGIALLFAAVFVFSPVKNALMKNGLIPYENVGNEIKVEKTYKDGFLADALNAIEEGKRTVVDTYTNYLPFYLEITELSKSIKRSLNEPITKRLSDIGDRIIRDKLLGKK